MVDYKLTSIQTYFAIYLWLFVTLVSVLVIANPFGSCVILILCLHLHTE